MSRRNTVQRTIVLDTVRKLLHSTAEEIHHEVQRVYPEIGLATVYRNLNVLISQQLIQKVHLPIGPDKYDSTVKPHYHLFCRKCGEIFDIDINYQHHLDELVSKSNSNFYVECHNITFDGVCDKCRKLVTS